MACYGSLYFSDDDVANIDDWIPEGEYNPHKVRPWLIHDHGFTVAVVFASHLQDALDAAVDADKLDAFLVTQEELADYSQDENGEYIGISYLGNAGEPFDIESLDVVELPNPAMSFARLFGNKLT